MTPTVFIHSPIKQWWRSVLFKTLFFNRDIFIYLLHVLTIIVPEFLLIVFYCEYEQMSEIKKTLLSLLLLSLYMFLR